MISVTGRNWEQKKNNKNLIEKLKQDYNFSDILSKLVSSRKFDEVELNSIDNNLFLNNVFSIKTFYLTLSALSYFVLYALGRSLGLDKILYLKKIIKKIRK